MHRYFIEVYYKGTGYAGFQVQENAITIQSEVEKALSLIFHEEIRLTGSSRTDAGVHSQQNFFHFDTTLNIPSSRLYNINAVLPANIAVRDFILMSPGAHCRFDAVSRKYEYTVYFLKDPFINDVGYYFPYYIKMDALNHAADLIEGTHDFTSFSKRNTQVKNFICTIYESRWENEGHILKYHVRGNRFLRGMVRGLVGTMLQVGRGKISIDEFISIIEAKDCRLSNFAVPGKGLCLKEVQYPSGYFEK